MKQASFAFATLALAFSLAVSHAESLERTEQALKAAESKLACCCKEASETLNTSTRGDLLLKQSQTAWEKYRDAAVAFEMGDIPRDNENKRTLYATIVLRLTNERIETIQRVFEYTLCSPSEIRVRNGSNVEFKNVIVGDKKYGDIKPGATTDYQRWRLAYRYSFVSLTAASEPLKIQPIDYFGETPLGEGKFTYVLTMENGRLEIRPSKDDQ